MQIMLLNKKIIAQSSHRCFLFLHLALFATNMLNALNIALLDCFSRSISSSYICLINHKYARREYGGSLRATWTAQIEYANRTLNLQSNEIYGCGHSHTLTIEFSYANKTENATENGSIQISASGSATWQSAFINISHSGPTGNYFMVGYAAISENYFKEDDKNQRYLKQLFVLTEWINYHLKSGFDHMAIYMDLDEPADEFYSVLQKGLVHLIEQDKVSLKSFLNTGREYMHFQQALGLHCLESFRGRAKWFAPFDVDEYFEPMSSFTSVRDAVVDIAKRNEGVTIQVRSQFWSSPDGVCWSTNISSFSHKKEGYIQEGNEKCLFDLDRIKYYSVHMPTTPPEKVNPDPDNELRLNHFKSFGCLPV